MNLEYLPTYTLELKVDDIGLPMRTLRTFSRAEFNSFCLANPHVNAEYEVNGTLTIMAPASPNSSRREGAVITDLTLYMRAYGGEAYSSSVGFTLPDGSVRSPDASYVSKEKLAGFTKEDLDHFAKIVPDFIVEVVSPSDTLSVSEVKMRETWMKNGVPLGWLIDVESDKLWIYRANGSVDLVTPLTSIITGEDVLPGFEFDLALLT